MMLFIQTTLFVIYKKKKKENNRQHSHLQLSETYIAEAVSLVFVHIFSGK